MRRLTSWRSKLLENVGFLCLQHWLVQQRFKILNIYTSSVRTKGTFWYQKLFDFAEIFSFTHLHLTLPCSNREKQAFVRLFSEGMWEKESIIDIHYQWENPNSRVHPLQWETRQASIPSATVDPRVRIFLSPLNTNDQVLKQSEWTRASTIITTIACSGILIDNEVKLFMK